MKAMAGKIEGAIGFAGHRNDSWVARERRLQPPEGSALSITEEGIEMPEGFSNYVSLPLKGLSGIRRPAVTMSSEELVPFGPAGAREIRVGMAEPITMEQFQIG